MISSHCYSLSFVAYHYIVLVSYPLNCHPTAKYVRAKHIFPGKLWPLCPSSFARGTIVCWQEWYTGTLNISFAFPLLVNVKYWQLVKLLWSNGPGCTCWEVIYCRHKHFGPMPRLCDKFSSCQITLFSNHCTGYWCRNAKDGSSNLLRQSSFYEKKHGKKHIIGGCLKSTKTPLYFNWIEVCGILSGRVGSFYKGADGGTKCAQYEPNTRICSYLFIALLKEGNH